MATASRRKLDPYEELGVDRTADDKAIKQAFRANVMERMLLHHIEELRRPIVVMLEAQAMRYRALELLKDYDFTRDVPQGVQVFMYSMSGASTSSTTTGY